MKPLLQKLFAGQELSRSEASRATDLMMRGEATAAEIAGFLGALAGKGVAVDEIVGCAMSLRHHALPIKVQRRDLIDVCGTGGDGADTFNISTTNALLLAAAGLGVCKHGNRAVSSRCGSADVLEALGVKVDLSPDRVAAAIDQCGFGFIFAPLFHPAMQHVAPIRRALGVRTIFNLLGPLVNPAPVKRQVLGVFESQLVNPMAEALLALDAERALVVWGAGGLDELSLTGPTQVAMIAEHKIRRFELNPADFDLPLAAAHELKGGDKEENAAHTLAILQGHKSPKRDIVLMNAGAALVVAELAESWRAGASLAAELIDSGRAMATFEKIRAFV